jgi:pimeloyl-ACP methyl ester carboxylesterase
MVKARKILITAGIEPGRSLSYLDYGPESGEVVLCAHGMTRNAYDFDYIARALSDKYRVIAVDLAGHGDSDPLQSWLNYNGNTHALDLLFLLDSLGVRRVHWIGTSLGGSVGIMIAGFYRPHLISKLVLNDIGPVIPDEALGYLANSVSAIYHKDAYTKDEYARLSKKVLAGWGVDGAKFEHLVQHGAKVIDGLYYPRFDRRILSGVKSWRAVSQVPMLSMWSAAQVPVLLMRGAKSVYVTDASVTQMRTTHRDLTVCQVGHCGHVCDLMDDKQISVIRNWLEGSGVVPPSIP